MEEAVERREAGSADSRFAPSCRSQLRQFASEGGNRSSVFATSESSCSMLRAHTSAESVEIEFMQVERIGAPRRSSAAPLERAHHLGGPAVGPSR